MREFQEKRKMRNFVFSWPIVGLLVVFNVVVGARLVGIYKESREAKKQEVAMLEQLKELQDKKAQLEAEVKRLSTEQGIEEELRKRFGVVKAGEEMLVIVDDNAGAGSGNAASGASRGFWGSVVSFFKLIF